MRTTLSRFREVRAYIRLDNPYLWAIVLRVGLLVLMQPHPRGDAGEFQTIAHNLAEGHGFSRCWQPPYPPTSQRPPLYPLILSILYLFGIGSVYAPGVLNTVFDLFSMKASEKFSRAAGLSHPRAFPWVLAFCPMLITMGNYPLTESLSVLLFFLASLYLFEQKSKRSGFTFGLLALCRSYYLLMPALLALFRPLKRLSRKALIVAMLFSFAAPSLWVARNFITLNHAMFSQSGTAGLQSYVGLCRRSFDWWDNDDVQHILHTSPFNQQISAQCMNEEQVLALDSQAWKHVSNCIESRPGDVAINLLVKTWNLFFAWGQIFPYDYVPSPARTIINILMMIIWARMIWIWVAAYKKGAMTDAFKYMLINIGYVFLVTLPFGIDARYLLAPSLLALGISLQMVDEPIDFVREPLERVFGEP
jgi:hypothetical protein